MKMPKWTCKLIELGKHPAPLTTLEVVEKEGAVFIAF
jgi:hypothetical protein